MIAGSPEAVESAATAAGTAATGFADVAEAIGRHAGTTTSAWTGSTAGKASERIMWWAQRTTVAQTALDDLGRVLRAYADDLREAQQRWAAGMAQADAGRSALATATDDVTAATALPDETVGRDDALADARQAQVGARSEVDEGSAAMVGAETMAQNVNHAAARTVAALTENLGSMTTGPLTSQAALTSTVMGPRAPARAPDGRSTWVPAPLPPGLPQGDWWDLTASVLDTFYQDAAFMGGAGMVLTPGGLLMLPAYVQAQATLHDWLVENGGADTETANYESGEWLALLLSLGVAPLAGGGKELVVRGGRALLEKAAERGLLSKGVVTRPGAWAYAKALAQFDRFEERLIAGDLKREALERWDAESGEGGTAAPTVKSQEVLHPDEPYYGPMSKRYFDLKWKMKNGFWRYPPDNGFVPETERINTLEPGAVIDRFGPNRGEFAAPDKGPFAERGLPPTSIDAQYHRFEVVKKLPDEVTEGKALPWFEQRGGGTQYYFGRKFTFGSEEGGGSLQWYIDHGFIKEILTE